MYRLVRPIDGFERQPFSVTHHLDYRIFVTLDRSRALCLAVDLGALIAGAKVTGTINVMGDTRNGRWQRLRRVPHGREAGQKHGNQTALTDSGHRWLAFLDLQHAPTPF